MHEYGGNNKGVAHLVGTQANVLCQNIRRHVRVTFAHCCYVALSLLLVNPPSVTLFCATLSWFESSFPLGTMVAESEAQYRGTKL